ncbi:leucyl aminopeptidase family protein [Sandarakinorhabdus oryzae]|uniref:leucyl aminopeptidase family protein n=1 Tax=Sandarakinorhabdus oryzae TaxID=2675220 RepID=UPI0012E2A637|nr:leucyl aminopeptidase family protein [Sandarakinorhabdus oryzae]
MTDFAALLAATDGQPSVPLIPVTKAGLDGWLATQSERVRVAVAAQDFKAAPDSIAILPGDGPADWFVVAGVADGSLGPWALAEAAAKLPAGRYALAGELGQAGLGWCLAQHKFSRYRRAEAKGARVLATTSLGAISSAVSEAQAVALVRDLVDTPASDLGPADLAQAVIDTLRPLGAEVQVTSGEALLSQNFPAVHAVGRAADQAPRLIEATWGDASHPVVAIIGKGITFDSGGLNIKPGSGMALMKKDMGGAAHALALATLVIQANLRVRLHLIIPAAENAISGNAMRPGDIIATRAGKTVEITNTDAEGRLVLCDAIALAAEKNPALILDFATLTGAARVALGPQLPALFANDDALASELLAAGAQVGDPVWRLPLWAPYHDLLKSSLADMVNSADGGFAGAITAALFLEKFVPAGVAWAHFDTFAWNNASRPGRPKGGEALALRASWAVLRSRFG